MLFAFNPSVLLICVSTTPVSTEQYSARIVGERVALQIHREPDLFLFGQIDERIGLFMDLRIFARALHGVFIRAFDRLGVVDRMVDEDFRILENLGIGIPALAFKQHAQVQPLAALDRVLDDLRVQHVDGESVGRDGIDFGAFAALFERKREACVLKLFVCHYRAPPLPPTTISLTRMRG